MSPNLLFTDEGVEEIRVVGRKLSLSDEAVIDSAHTLGLAVLNAYAAMRNQLWFTVARDQVEELLDNDRKKYP